MGDVISDILKPIVISVNETLKYFEEGYTSVQRCPIVSREPAESFRQYIECRFNYEAFKFEELRPYAEYFDGYLFEVISVAGEDTKKRRYSEVCIEICTNPMNFMDSQYEGVTFIEVIEAVRNILGGNRIYFNQSAKIPKIRVE